MIQKFVKDHLLNRSPGFHACIAAGLLASIALASIYFTLPTSVLSPNGEPGKTDRIRATFNQVLPQNWAFFTRSPSQETIAIYGPAEPAGARMMRTPNSRLENAFGISRTQRAQGPEIAILRKMDLSWTECNLRPVLECVAAVQASPLKEVQNTVRVRTICGPAVIVLQRPVTFMYRNEYPEASVGIRAAGIYAHC